MNTNKNSREYGRDQEQQNQDRDHKNQNQNRGQDEQRKDHDRDQDKLGNPKRLQDNDHRMDKRTNDVEMGDTFRQNKPQGSSTSNYDVESHWNDIKSDYRQRYPDVTDEDVNYKSGEFDNLTDRIAKRTNRNLEDVKNEIRDWDSSTENG